MDAVPKIKVQALLEFAVHVGSPQALPQKLFFENKVLSSKLQTDGVVAKHERSSEPENKLFTMLRPLSLDAVGNNAHASKHPDRLLLASSS